MHVAAWLLLTALASFTYGEECVLRQNQGNTIDMLQRQLRSKSALDIRRKCIELGLNCGGA
ncbi:hypothetical protein SPRG_02236 [Saprolegnia parasitica CBS 223.65]|uniref:Uncharacterized protein n=1 Tax=Saprolegnia parasitica (strain CBS 223.65) TaxID=695850 RepID=A0A067CRT4_SAPPC|nr:hypothetical protein SPRG_02236 [Saprolegnia parasitica CBS 223.65]KDO33429.1 hypothetical protein SPRG_02236 [Saprolegnia parasitica CBS 223.65]|eukprot:XP_012196175.1 hypothetical protein SPRG_02236 [Saprolegnia parasitica CBS 223.65]